MRIYRRGKKQKQKNYLKDSGLFPDWITMTVNHRWLATFWSIWNIFRSFENVWKYYFNFAFSTGWRIATMASISRIIFWISKNGSNGIRSFFSSITENEKYLLELILATKFKYSYLTLVGPSTLLQCWTPFCLARHIAVYIGLKGDLHIIKPIFSSNRNSTIVKYLKIVNKLTYNRSTCDIIHKIPKKWFLPVFFIK